MKRLYPVNVLLMLLLMFSFPAFAEQSTELAFPSTAAEIEQALQPIYQPPVTGKPTRRVGGGTRGELSESTSDYRSTMRGQRIMDGTIAPPVYRSDPAVKATLAHRNRMDVYSSNRDSHVNDVHTDRTEPPRVGARILFEFDSAIIQAESYPLLKEYAKALQGQLADAVIVVAGHADSDGAADYNLSLSQRRANAVKDFLINSYDLPKNPQQRLATKGYGETQPLTANTTPAGKALNRRVEFVRIGTVTSQTTQTSCETASLFRYYPRDEQTRCSRP